MTATTHRGWMGGPMMGGRTTLHDAVMWLTADRASVPAVRVSFLVT